MTHRIQHQIPGCMFICLVFLFIFGIQCSNKNREELSGKQTIQIAESGEPASDPSLAIDSLQSLLALADHDTLRLKYLDQIAEIRSDPELISAILARMDSIIDLHLADNSAEEDTNTYLKYRAAGLFRKGALHFDQFDLESAMEYFRSSLEIAEAIDDKSRTSSCYMNIGNLSYYLGEIDSAIGCYGKAFEICEVLADTHGMAGALNNMGIMYGVQEDIEGALACYTKSLKLDEHLGNKGRMGNTMVNIGVLYSYEADMPHALEYYMKGLKLKEEVGDSNGIAASLSNIATIYDYQKDYDIALEYAYRALHIQEKTGDIGKIPGTLTNIGNFYANIAMDLPGEDRDQRDSLRGEALGVYHRALNLSEETGSMEIIAETLLDLGVICRELAQDRVETDPAASDSLISLAINYHSRSLEIAEETGDLSSVAFALTYLGEIYYDKNEISRALNYAKRAHKIATEMGYKFNIKQAADLLNNIYVKLGNYRLAYTYYDEAVTLNDSIIKEENQQMIQKNYFQYQYEKQAATDSIAHSKEMQIATLEIEKQKAESHRQKLVIIFVILGLLLVSGFMVYFFRSLRTTRKQKNIIEDQKSRIENIHEALTDSIRYAEKIQTAVLPGTDYFREISADFRLSPEEVFILYKPRDIVSGDFYFFRKRDELMYIAAADCTGHGVPGAFMSMLGISLLDNIIAQEVADTAGGILDKLREQIIHSLKQRGIEGEQKDGMDMIFIIYDERTRKIQYAGANNHLFLIPKDKKELKVIKADRMPVAIYEFMDPFSTRVIQLRKGDTLYMASDGYQDQFGGPNGKKFYSKYLKKLLVEICERPMAEQKAILDKTIEEWKNNYEQKYEQTDDITIVGIRIA